MPSYRINTNYLRNLSRLRLGTTPLYRTAIRYHQLWIPSPPWTCALNSSFNHPMLSFFDEHSWPNEPEPRTDRFGMSQPSQLSL